MLPDCVDWGEYALGKRVDGLTTSTMTFMNKLSQAIAGSAAMAVLGVAGFVANQEQTQTVCNIIVILRFLMPALGSLASVISLYFYELTEPRVREISVELAAKHNAKKQ